MGNQPTFFDFAAEVGLTKHIGGVEATEALIELCHKVADAQDLPFEDAVFDAVITESVTAFPESKQKAVNE